MVRAADYYGVTVDYLLGRSYDKNGYNMMTASWGFMGEMWGADTCIAMVRPQRYTMDFIDKNDIIKLLRLCAAIFREGVQ